MGSNIKIFMCAHKSFEILPAFSVAVQGGAAINPRITGTLRDFGEGGSISEKNPDYCELTVQYYAWRNEDADYYGFCHYRRFLSFDEKIKPPYLVFGGGLPEKYLSVICDEERVRAEIESSDLILPRSENMGEDVYSQYSSVGSCKKEDLLIFRRLIAEKYPELVPFAEEYLSGERQYFCNMFVMRREIFFDYSDKLFSLLEEFDKIKSGGKIRGDRVDGFIAERFLGIYALYLKAGGAKIREFARLDVFCDFKKRLLYKLFPPESKIRFKLKRATSNIKKKKEGD